MQFNILKTSLAEIQELRNLFLAEISFQFVYHKCHAAGWADTYIFTLNGSPVGYGSLWGKNNRMDRDTVFEFYLLEPFRRLAGKVFREFARVSGAAYINCQSNDTCLTAILFEHANTIHAEAILFEDSIQTNFEVSHTVFRKSGLRGEHDPQYVLEQNGQVVASGGHVWSYNFPYIDIYYEVDEDHRQKGLGSLITQELKNEAYRMNRVPSARCNIKNIASKATLLKAGMRVCGHILLGTL
ncbi:hypothetical protein GCM10007415_08130 [Parapedobacter pyrenivorans]|uniref:N-acetyltransferase domain-containing protein n=1 Tax=Parapedobacter pyrenivorans TaxID=1305674 RepID=A0A917HGI4_9SPHI|nr:GNAT family N-acetyltransferase [Parapedobacter pyrenivorans]GGG78464.1 hypothetical protein GCM10007415_08130 [Parapedobacter pyrenivorans]